MHEAWLENAGVPYATPGHGAYVTAGLTGVAHRRMPEDRPHNMGVSRSQAGLSPPWGQQRQAAPAGL